MKKVLDFLEANVQWVALGLGVLWVLLMAWTYAISTDRVVAKVGGTELTPGGVDPYIVENAANELRAKMDATKVPPAIPSPKWAQAFRDGMANKGEQVAALDPMISLAMVAKPGPGGGRGPGVDFADVVVEKLPALPPAVMAEARSGMSNVALPQQLAAAPANGNAEADAGAAPAGAEVQPVAQVGKDIVWITNLYRIPMTELLAAFRDVRLPPDQYNTTVLEITLEREEQMPDGSWGKLTTIRPLPTVQLRPMPADAARVKEKTDHLQWAITNVESIVQPRFYDVLRGDAWAPPGQAAPEVVADADQQPATTEQFDPSKYVDATHEELMKLTPEQRRAVAAYKKKKEDEERQNRQKDRGGKGGKGGLGGLGGGGGGGLGGGGRGGGGGFGPNDGGRSGGGFQDPGAGDPASGAQRGQREDAPAPGYVPNEGTPGIGYQGQGEQQQPEAPAGGQYPLPPGEFDPSRSQGQDIIGWAHDDTCEAGKTYRYRVTYKLKSPVWNTQNMTKPQELAERFAIASKASEWGQPVKVESLSHFWVVRPAFRGESAQVQVFRFSGGQLRTKVFEVSPGDAIGGPDGDVDYGTGWTMVDMPTDARGERYVLLMDPHGRLQPRDFRADQADPKYKEMKEQADAAAAAANGAGGDAVAGTR